MSRLGGIRRHLVLSGRVVRAVLRSPALRRVQLAFLLFNAAEYGTWVAILLYAYEAIGPAAVGVVAIVQLVPAALLAPAAAVFADRRPRHHVLLAGYLLQAVAYLAVAAGMLTGAGPALVIPAAVVAALTLTLTRPAHGALLPGLARTPEELTAANGLSGTVEGAGVLVGPLVAAGLLAVGTPGLVFAAGAVAALLAAALVAWLPVTLAARPVGGDAGPHDHPADGDGGESPLALMADGLRAMLANAATRLVVGLLGLRMVTIGALDVLFVLLALDVFHTGEAGAGILNAALGLGTIIGGAASFTLVGRQRLAPALAAAASASGLALVVLGGIERGGPAALVIVVAGVGLAASDVAGRTILQRVADDRVLARVLGGLEGASFIGLAIGSLIAPLLAAWLGTRGAVVVVGAVLPTGVAAAWLGLRAIDRRVRVPVRELALLKASPLFAPLAPPQLEAVASRTRWITAEPGEILIREGDPGDRYLVLESGHLAVSVGGRAINEVADRGDGVGEIALLRDIPRTATVAATAPCVLLALGRAEFLAAVTGHEHAVLLAEQIAVERIERSDGAR